MELSDGPERGRGSVSRRSGQPVLASCWYSKNYRASPDRRQSQPSSHPLFHNLRKRYPWFQPFVPYLRDQGFLCCQLKAKMSTICSFLLFLAIQVLTHKFLSGILWVLGLKMVDVPVLMKQCNSMAGLKGLYRGLGSNLASSAPISAIYTLTYEAVKAGLLRHIPAVWIS